MKVAVVGAGWAGLAAASQLRRHGVSVTLYDSGHQPGGRARGYIDPLLGELDNGQHLFIGAYQATLELMCSDLGEAATQAAFLRQPLSLRDVDCHFTMRVNSSLPSSIQNLCALWWAQGLTLKDKWHATRFLLDLNNGSNRPGESTTVSQWLAEHDQTLRNCQWLWYPLCLATMNTDPDEACANLFCNVLSDSLLNPTPGSTDFLIPRRNLSDLWPQFIAANVNTRWGQTVRDVDHDEQQVGIEGEYFDACVMAVPPTNLKRIVGSWPNAAALVGALARFDYRAITTCYVKLDRQLDLPAPMLMFKHSEDGKSIGQWVFDRNRFMSEKPQAQLAFVVSDSSHIQTWSDQEVSQTLIEQLTQALSQKDPPNILGARCFHEKRATFAAVPGLQRPQTQTPWPRVLIAGDWTDTGYPAVIEGAVRSGMKAADAVLQLQSLSAS